jgi:hypothetical protein
MNTAWSAPFRPYEYWADIAENEPDFLIDGLLHAATNTVSGKPTVGKTRLAAAMAAAIAKEDNEFCGSKTSGPAQSWSSPPTPGRPAGGVCGCGNTVYPIAALALPSSTRWTGGNAQGQTHSEASSN